MMKNPQMTVMSNAASQLAANGTPIEQTIKQCIDPRCFVAVQRVAGGATWRNHSLGSVVRWYWSTDNDPILYASNGKLVSKTTGAKPLMELTDRLPDDIDYARYIKEARKLASDLAVVMDGRLF